MKAQRRRFVVEVKRGTNRASFMSTDAAAEKFSSAEDALFGPRTRPGAVSMPASSEPAPKPPAGRVLRDLQEPPPPVLEVPPPARRGRKPGSKNKPKPVLANGPVSTVPPKKSVRPIWADALAAEDRSPAPASVHAAEPAPIEPVSAAAAGERPSSTRRPRFRDRSTIIKRYVLGTEPAPGQTGWIRGLRAKRQG